MVTLWSLTSAGRSTPRSSPQSPPWLEMAGACNAGGWFGVGTDARQLFVARVPLAGVEGQSAAMPDLWVEFPRGYTTAEVVDVSGELGRWPVYHDSCGMAPVDIDVRDADARLECSGCPWAERIPLQGEGTPAGRHNGAALARLATRREPQTLQLHTVMGGLAELAAAVLVGRALRVTIAPSEEMDTLDEKRWRG